MLASSALFRFRIWSTSVRSRSQFLRMMSHVVTEPGQIPARLAISSTGAAISATGVRISLATSVKRLTLASSRSSLFLWVIEATFSQWCARGHPLRRSQPPPTASRASTP